MGIYWRKEARRKLVRDLHCVVHSRNHFEQALLYVRMTVREHRRYASLMESHDNASIASVIGALTQTHKKLVKVFVSRPTIISPNPLGRADMTDIEGESETHVLQRVGRP